jgi:hypothetical protein
MNEQPTVADYIVRRLAREGSPDSLGVAGDFAFKLCDAVARSEAIRGIGCSNELGAAYAADVVDRDDAGVVDRKRGTRPPFFRLAPDSEQYDNDAMLMFELITEGF